MKSRRGAGRTAAGRAGAPAARRSPMEMERRRVPALSGCGADLMIRRDLIRKKPCAICLPDNPVSFQSKSGGAVGGRGGIFPPRAACFRRDA